MKWVLLAHAFATLYMTGVIWMVQLVHYPLFDRADRTNFAAFEAAHTQRITWVVMPPMLVELALAAMLVYRRPEGIPTWWVWSGLALVAVIWASTFLLQVPQHTRLGSGFDVRAHRFLVGSNWVRTVAWTLRAGLALAMLSARMR